MDGGRFVDLGIAFAGATAAVTLQPWASPQIASDAVQLPVSPKSLATAFALLTLAGFLGRRYNWIDHRIGMVATVGGSVGVVLATLGLTVLLTDAGVAVTLWPPLTISFAVTTGLLGVIDWTGLRSDELLDRLELLVVVGIVAIAALVLGGVSDLLFQVVVSVLSVGDRLFADALAQQLSTAVGMYLVTAVFIFRHDAGLGFVDASWLTTRDLLYCLGGFIALLLVLLFSAELLAGLGVPTSGSGIADRGVRGRPELFLLILPIAALVVAPAEELLLRNVVQKSLYSSYTRESAVVLSGCLHATIYLPTYATVALSAALGGLTLVLLLSLVLGITYERTDNVLVPVLIHSAFNAFQYAVLYVAVTQEVGIS